MPVNSGYRNPTWNAQIQGAAAESFHIYGRAADIANRDWNNDGRIDRRDQVLMQGLVEDAGGRVENLARTPTWVHMQW